MIEMETPCMKCLNRYLGCHSKCKAYADYKKELQRIKDRKDKDREFEKYVSFNINTGRTKNIKSIRNYGLND